MIANMKSPLMLLALASVALTGCASGRDSITVGSVPDDYRTRHPIVINQVEQTLDVAIASGVHRLDRPTQSNIEAFANEFAGSGGGVIVVLEPAGSANSQSVIKVRDDIITAIEAGGVQRHQIAIQTYDASQHAAAAPLRLSYHAVDAQVAECGNWYEDLASNPENKQYHDFGCSTQANLASIIANPNDLMGPRAVSPIDPIQRATVIQNWQEGSQPIQSEVEY